MTRDEERIIRAQLADAPLALIVAELRRRGCVVRPLATHGGQDGAGPEQTITQTGHESVWVDWKDITTYPPERRPFDGE